MVPPPAARRWHVLPSPVGPRVSAELRGTRGKLGMRPQPWDGQESPARGRASEEKEHLPEFLRLHSGF